jgi:hypothetical protein
MPPQDEDFAQSGHTHQFPVQLAMAPALCRVEHSPAEKHHHDVAPWRTGYGIEQESCQKDRRDNRQVDLIANSKAKTGGVQSAGGN